LWHWLRHNVAAVVTTVVDYSIMVALVELGGFGPVPATALGALAGAITNFTLGRFFTYRVRREPMVGQALRYALISGASLGWNSLGEYLFASALGLQYFVARVVTSVIVSTAWNYPMQRFYVFSRRATGGAPREPLATQEPDRPPVDGGPRTG
jgi:putative flippase GtrA